MAGAAVTTGCAGGGKRIWDMSQTVPIMSQIPIEELIPSRGSAEGVVRVLAMGTGGGVMMGMCATGRGVGEEE